MGKINYLLRQLTSTPIIIYQMFVRPILKPACRFYPSCSEYALSAIKVFGVLKGIKLAYCRILRCHPWCEGGFDPVLPNKEKS